MHHPGTLSLVFLLGALLPDATTARETDARGGNSIIPTFSLQHEALEPNQSAQLVACLTNSNARATREMQAGDRFSFHFGDGDILTCAEVGVFSRDGSLSSSDFECDVDENVLALTYVGEGATWPAGDTACTQVEYVAGSGSSTALTRMDVGNQGAYAATQPAVLFISVAPGIGIIGPEGPAGPSGPPGPRGPVGPQGRAGIGNSAFVTSTGAARKSICDPPMLVPGLEATLAVSEGSRILVLVDADQHDECLPNRTVRADARLDIELDGALVAHRHLSWSAPAAGGDSTTAVSMAFSSEPLGAGAHTVRLLLEDLSVRTSCHDHTLCIGSAENDEHQARMVLLEVRGE